ncbi:hypothetical protein OSB04_004876 [Centaurea solstitialis]|uniref:Uncharacterized protein n=1 Tax=Centaurea solstitialis TaxID=347529 RepID=A0AA38WRS2_9ASTR|nr:hypothetical protein OSB04_004876 [Centaurea solstitialis]
MESIFEEKQVLIVMDGERYVAIGAHAGKVVQRWKEIGLTWAHINAIRNGSAQWVGTTPVPPGTPKQWVWAGTNHGKEDKYERKTKSSTLANWLSYTSMNILNKNEFKPFRTHHLAYEYARHGASLVLVARRDELLVTVARKAMEIGSPETIMIKVDVSNLQDCKRFVDEAIKHFGKVDCLVNNVGTAIVGLFEDQVCITDHASVMYTKINENVVLFFLMTSVNAMHFALSHLKKSKGRIVVIGSCGGWFAMSRVSMGSCEKCQECEKSF